MGISIFSLFIAPSFAEIAHLTDIAPWRARDTYLSAKPHDTVAEIACAKSRFLEKFPHRHLDFIRIFFSLGIKTKSATNTDTMRVSDNPARVKNITEQLTLPWMSLTSL
jgi:hypothetical protein